jgi:hypothetical protein
MLQADFVKPPLLWSLHKHVTVKTKTFEDSHCMGRCLLQYPLLHESAYTFDDSPVTSSAKVDGSSDFVGNNDAGDVPAFAISTETLPQFRCFGDCLAGTGHLKSNARGYESHLRVWTYILLDSLLHATYLQVKKRDQPESADAPFPAEKEKRGYGAYANSAIPAALLGDPPQVWCICPADVYAHSSLHECASFVFRNGS